MSIPFKQCNERNYRKGREFAINWICLHFTSGNGDTAQNNADYFAREGGLNASAHYFVDTERIVQSVKDGDTAWHCGRERGGSYYNDCRNANSIGIEMCSVVRNGVYVIPEATMKNAAKLTRELMAKYHIPVSRVCRHYDVTRKNCPEPWIRDPRLWEKFKTMLTEKEVEDMTEAQTRAIAKQEIANAENAKKVYNTVDAVPAWGKATVQKLVNKGFLQGDDQGKLALTTDLLRLLVINDRAHLYG
jgi:N-acetylmuramoyl-L-alanine amidase CwlA|nr:MAG TPA: N acetylmuramoyl L alanine amidase endolysin [Caudoviricetes sp.]